MSQEIPDVAHMMRQMQMGINALSKSVSVIEDRLSDVESETRTQAGMLAAVSDGYPPRAPSSGSSGSAEGRTFAVQSETVGEGESAETEYFVVNCRFMFGRRVVILEEDFVLPSHEEGGATVVDDGKYYLIIPHEDPDDAFIADDPGDGNDDVTTVIPLFEYSGGELVDDYRGLPTIPVYETDEDIVAANGNL